MFMENILRPKNSILVENDLPRDYGIIKAREALDSVRDVDEDTIFEQRTREALDRVEARGIKGVPASQFLKELD